MRFLHDTFPLVVVLHGARFDDLEFQEMVAGYERYLGGSERYAVLTVSPGTSVHLGAHERKLIADWVNTPRVRETSGRLCVGSATVVPSAIARGALTALFWFWTPPSPHRAVSTVEEGIDFCVRRFQEAHVSFEGSTESVCRQVTGSLRSLGGFAPSLGAIELPRPSASSARAPDATTTSDSPVERPSSRPERGVPRRQP